MAEHKFDIFKALAAIDRRDGNYFANLTEDERKDFSPFLFIRWVSAVVGRHAEDNLHVTNELVNPHMFDIAKEHPELIFRLVAMCGTGSVQKHEWIGVPKRQTTSSRAWNFVADLYPSASEREIDMLLRMHTRESFAELVDDAAVPNDQVAELIKSHDKLNAKATGGTTEEKPKSSRKRKT